VLALRHVGSKQVALVSASDLPAFFGPKHLWRWLKSRCDSHRISIRPCHSRPRSRR
jgi:hypothetical protein